VKFHAEQFYHEPKYQKVSKFFNDPKLGWLPNRRIKSIRVDSVEISRKSRLSREFRLSRKVENIDLVEFSTYFEFSTDFD
jgi:hypothetical protein